MIQKYYNDIIHIGNGMSVAEMIPDETGAWVSNEDYETLESEKNQLQVENDKLKSIMKNLFSEGMWEKILAELASS